MQYLAILLTALLFQGSVLAEDEVANTQPDRGWFWYQTDPEPEPDTQEIPATPKKSVSKDKEKKSPMSVAWLRKMIPILEERAVDNPTKDNLKALFYVKRVMQDKSQRFAEAAQTIVYSEPMLDENNRIPLAKFAKDDVLNKQIMAKTIALKYLAKNKGGLFMFFDSTCSFCKTQLSSIESLKKKYGFDVRYISMDGKGLPGIKEWINDNGLSKRLELKIYPTTVFAVPPSNFLIISQGMMAVDQLEERMLIAARDQHLLPRDMDTDTNPFDRGVLTVEDTMDGASDNPEEFVNYIKEKLKDRY